MTAGQSLADTLVLARRSLLRIPRQPDLLVGFTVQPIMFVLLFVYVFGGAISTPGVSYVNYLIPGIIIQSMTFGGFVDRPRPRRGSEEGADRPLPVVADVARRGADRQDARRPGHELLPARRHARGRARRSASASKPGSYASSPGSRSRCSSATPSRGCSR